jgi:hypothetical protein
MSEVDDLGIDPDGRLYWNGKPVGAIRGACPLLLVDSSLIPLVAISEREEPRHLHGKLVRG